MKNIKLTKKTIIVGAIVGLGLSSVSPAQANILGFLANSFGYGDLYTAGEGLYTASSELFQTIGEVSAQISNGVAKGNLGITDPNKAIAAAQKLFKQEGNGDDAGIKSSRMNARIGAQVASAPISTEGQKQAEKMMQNQQNLSTAGNTAAVATSSSTSSLEAIQNSAQVSNAIAQQLPAITTLLTQSNQTAAGAAQISDNISQELSRANAEKDRDRAYETNTIDKAGSFVGPAFVKR